MKKKKKVLIMEMGIYIYSSFFRNIHYFLIDTVDRYSKV